MIRELAYRFKKMKFEIVFCHRLPNRTPIIWLLGKPRRLLCYRCCGAAVGFILPWILLFMNNMYRQLIFLYPLTGFTLSLLLFLPMGIDGLGQALGYWSSTNLRRFLTGLGGGAAQTILAMIVAGLLLRIV
ncbi:MAG: DUF2085 domain-containing protein [Candidatus Heimdallarchaeota archaeon]